MLLLTNKTIEKLKHDLVREGLVELDGLMLAQENAKINSTNLAQELVKENLITETVLLKFIEDKLHIPFVDLRDYTPDTNCLAYISSENAQKYNIFPLFKIEDVLTIAMSDPLDLFTINTLFEFSDISIEPVVCTETSIKEAIKEYYLKQNTSYGNETWQDMLISDNINDEILKKAIWDILKDAIKTNTEHIFMERSHTGLNIFFNKEIKGFIPNLLVPRFMFEFKNLSNLDNEIEEIAQSSKFTIDLNNQKYSILVSLFPTKFGSRISIIINKPIKNITEYNFDEKKLNELFSHPALIGINDLNKNEANSLFYALAEYLSEEYNILMVESNIKYELSGIAQIEFHKNTALYFDEIINQIDLQRFDIIFFEKIYTKEQANKLKMFTKEKIIVTNSTEENFSKFDFQINTQGKIF